MSKRLQYEFTEKDEGGRERRQAEEYQKLRCAEVRHDESTDLSYHRHGRGRRRG